MSSERTDTPLFSASGVTVTRSGRRVLDEVSVEARAGEIVVIVGPNGAGKTTLLEAIVGLVPREGGRVCVRAEEVRSFAHGARSFAYMPDDAELPEECSVATSLGIRARDTALSPLLRDLGIEPLPWI